MWIGKSAIAIFLVAQLYRRLKTAKLVCTVLLSQIMTNKRGQEMSGTVLIGFWILIITPCTPLRIYLIWFDSVSCKDFVRFVAFSCFHTVTLVMFLWVVCFPKSLRCISSRLSWLRIVPAVTPGTVPSSCKQLRWNTFPIGCMIWHVCSSYTSSYC